MPTYRVTCTVYAAQGTQSWLLVAKDLEEAREKFEAGDYVFEYEEVEVTQLGEPEIDQESDEDMDLENYLSDHEIVRKKAALLPKIRKHCEMASTPGKAVKAIAVIRELIKKWTAEKEDHHADDAKRD